MNWLKLIICLLFTVGLGSLGGIFTAGEINGWYTTIQKPSFNPPNGWFGPVWTFLYVIMGLSVYLIWKQPASHKRNTALFVFIIQFIFNFFWSFIFFKLHLIGWALVEIILLWLLILITILSFRKIVPLAAWMLVPYLAWVSFATVLNAAIYFLNR